MFKKILFGCLLFLAVFLISPEYQGVFLQYETILRLIGGIIGLAAFLLFVIIYEDNRQKEQEKKEEEKDVIIR